MAELDADNPEHFAQAADVYVQQAGELTGKANQARRGTSVQTGGITGREDLVRDLNNAFVMVGDKMEQDSQGIQAYASATRRVGDLYQSQLDVSTQLLGTVLNDADRFDKTTQPGGI
jgi:hypothetical protein